MKKIILLFAFLMITISLPLYLFSGETDSENREEANSQPRTFEFKETIGNQYLTLGYNITEVLVNNIFNQRIELSYKVESQVEAIEEDVAKINAEWYILTGENPRNESAWTYYDSSTFSRYPNGEYVEDPETYLPAIRSFPVFPKEPIEPGDGWVANSIYSLDYRQYGEENPFQQVFTVEYRYNRNETLDDSLCAIIDVYYLINVQFSIPISGYNPSQWYSQDGTLAVRESRRVKGTLIWNIDQSFPKSFKYKTTVLKIQENGTIIEENGFNSIRYGHP